MKLVLKACAVALLMGSCAPQKEEQTDRNEKIVKQYFDYFNQHEWDKMASLYSQTAEFRDPALGAGIVKQTRADITKKYAELSSVFPDITDEVMAIYPSGEKHIVVEFVSRGTGPDSAKFELPICTVFTIEEGLITKDFTYYDNFEE